MGSFSFYSTRASKPPNFSAIRSQKPKNRWTSTTSMPLIATLRWSKASVALRSPRFHLRSSVLSSRSSTKICTILSYVSVARKVTTSQAPIYARLTCWSSAISTLPSISWQMTSFSIWRYTRTWPNGTTLCWSGLAGRSSTRSFRIAWPNAYKLAVKSWACHRALWVALLRGRLHSNPWQWTQAYSSRARIPPWTAAHQETSSIPSCRANWSRIWPTQRDLCSPSRSTTQKRSTARLKKTISMFLRVESVSSKCSNQTPLTSHFNKSEKKERNIILIIY